MLTDCSQCVTGDRALLACLAPPRGGVLHIHIQRGLAAPDWLTGAAEYIHTYLRVRGWGGGAHELVDRRPASTASSPSQSRRAGEGLLDHAAYLVTTHHHHHHPTPGGGGGERAESPAVPFRHPAWGGLTSAQWPPRPSLGGSPPPGRWTPPPRAWSLLVRRSASRASATLRPVCCTSRCWSCTPPVCRVSPASTLARSRRAWRGAVTGC